MPRAPRALITGFTGMVGSHLADHLLAETHWDVVGFARWNDDLGNVDHLLPRINEHDRVSLVYGDLNDHASVARAVETVRPDYVFHLAAQSYPQTSFQAPLETLQTNILGTAALLDAIHRSAQRPVVHVCASSEVFGRVGREHLPIGEDAPFHPASPYAISKVGTDLVGRFYAEAYGLCVMTTRAYHLLVTKDPIPGAYYNIGGSFSCTVGDMLRHLLSLSSRDDIRVVTDPERLRPIDADLQVPDTRKFHSHTGWTPQIPFEQTMRDLLEYWRDRVRSGRNFLVR